MLKIGRRIHPSFIAMPEATRQPFHGFEKPDQNWFRLPKSWATTTRSITSIAELKVVEYVLQHTWAQHEHGASKCISTNEFRFGIRNNRGERIDPGTGLSKPSVITGLKKAVERGLLIETVDRRDKARIRKSYRLRMKGETESPSDVSNKANNHGVDPDVKLFDPVNSFDPNVKEFDIGLDNGNGIGSQETSHTVTDKRLQNSADTCTTQNSLSTRPSTATANVDRSREAEHPDDADSPLRKLPDNALNRHEREHLVDIMLEKFGDAENKAYYVLVSRKIPDQFIWQHMGEVFSDTNIRYPERVFAARIKNLATDRLKAVAAESKLQQFKYQRADFRLGAID